MHFNESTDRRMVIRRAGVELLLSLLIELGTSGGRARPDRWDSCRQVGAGQQQPLWMCLSRTHVAAP